MPLSMYIKSISYVPLEEIESSYYYHYNAVSPTLTSNGCKEHWVSKSSGAITFVEPNGDFIEIEEMPNLTYEEISTWSSNDIRIDPKYVIEGDKMQFGSYPQTLVMDNRLKARLKHLAGGKAPSLTSMGNWKLLNHYSSGSKANNMFYQDVYDSVTGSMYRGIYLLENRPFDPVSILSGANEILLLNQSTQYNNGYYTGRYYWFKYEPIVWDINAKSSTTYVLTSNLVLDAFEFDYNINSNSQTTATNKGENSYKNSTLRAFLNSEFKNTAFSESQLSLIRDYSVDSEKDKVSINSESNILSFYETTEARMKSPTSYALAMGVYSSTGDVYGTCNYWLKSSSMASYSAKIMANNGISSDRYVWYTNTGVVPCITINLGGFLNEQ